MTLPHAGPPEVLERIDRRMVRFMRARGLLLLRCALGVVFVWFGTLKLLGVSPVAGLVAQTFPWVSPGVLLPVLGAWEVVVGAGLLAGAFMRVVLLLFWLQMAGTFLVLVLRPDISFQGGNPFLLTTAGEFVVKNLVLIAAGIALGGTVKRPLKAALKAPGAGSARS